MTVRAARKTVLHEAEKMVGQLRARWPEIQTRISLETWEGEDAYIWITVSEAIEDEVLDFGSGLTAELYEQTGIYIPKVMEVIRSHQGASAG